jgi:hypothetical protein
MIQSRDRRSDNCVKHSMISIFESRRKGRIIYVVFLTILCTVFIQNICNIVFIYISFTLSL